MAGISGIHWDAILTIIVTGATGIATAYRFVIKRVEATIITKADLSDLAQKLPINGNKFLSDGDLEKICSFKHQAMIEHIDNDNKRINNIGEKLSAIAGDVAYIKGRIDAK